jgi:hypothetical protein
VPSSSAGVNQSNQNPKFVNIKIDHFRFVDRSTEKSSKLRMAKDKDSEQQLNDSIGKTHGQLDLFPPSANNNNNQTSTLPSILPIASNQTYNEQMIRPRTSTKFRINTANYYENKEQQDQEDTKTIIPLTPYKMNSPMQKMTYLKKYVANNLRSKNDIDVSVTPFADSCWNRIPSSAEPKPTSAISKSTYLNQQFQFNNNNNNLSAQSRVFPNPSQQSNYNTNKPNMSYMNAVVNTKELSIIDIQLSAANNNAQMPMGFQPPLGNHLRKSATKLGGGTAPNLVNSNTRPSAKQVSNANGDSNLVSKLNDFTADPPGDLSSARIGKYKKSKLLDMLNSMAPNNSIENVNASEQKTTDAVQRNNSRSLAREQEQGETINVTRIGQDLQKSTLSANNNHFKALLCQQRKNKMNVNGIPIISARASEMNSSKHVQHQHLDEQPMHHQANSFVKLANNSLLIRRLKF